ncbi:LOW QUALITY PROTEIN: zygote arrest protein 1 [Diretmus argenteus]
MASYGDESVDSYFYSSYNPYTGRYPKPKDAGWKYKSYLSHYGDNTESFNNAQRAQLKSILSQINPKLTPRLRKANTKDVAVQEPKTDASVQCSIGPRTLLAEKRDSLRKRRQEDAPVCRSPQAGGVRYPRTLAVFPIAYRSVTSFLVEDAKEGRLTRRLAVVEEVGDPPDPAGGRKVEDEPVTAEEKSTKPAEQRRKTNKAKQPVKTDEVQPGQDGAAVKARVRFQFLEQKYGYYHCRECNLRWESAYVWCVQGTNKVYFKQFCRKCQKDFNPYRVEDITCHTCNKARCSCAVTPRHVDPKRPHRQDLCGRCKGKRLSCDSTFSFKYII